MKEPRLEEANLRAPHPEASVERGHHTRDSNPQRDNGNTKTCNKPLHNRGKVCNACRQKAYRERK